MRPAKKKRREGKEREMNAFNKVKKAVPGMSTKGY